jgi:hypothetical protein
MTVMHKARIEPSEKIRKKVANVLPGRHRGCYRPVAAAEAGALERQGGRTSSRCTNCSMGCMGSSNPRSMNSPSALAAFGGPTRAAIGATSAAGDEVTVDLFNEITGEVGQQRWFIEAHLQAGT